MRESIDRAVSAFLDSLPSMREIPLPETLQQQLGQLSDFTAKARSVIQTLRNSREPMKMAQTERATGLAKKTTWRALDDLRVLGLVELANKSWGLRKEWK